MSTIIINNRRKNRSKDEWETIVKECVNSGMDQAEWCKEHNVGYRTYLNYRRLFLGSSRKSPNEPKPKTKPKLTTMQRNYYISVAKELCYSKNTIDSLRKATTEFECEHIMTVARKGMK